MQAVVIEEYGSAELLKEQEIERPVPGDFEVLVKVKAASMNPIDWKIRRGDLRLLIPKRFPRVLGGDFAGIIEEVGKSVKGFKPGDAVFGMVNPLRTQYGSYAQYAIAAVDNIAKKPEKLSFADAAAIPIAGLTALKALRDQAGLKPEKEVLINGASGGVGSFAVQIAKVMGTKITATCSEQNFDFVKSLGADEVIDYRKEDVSKLKKRKFKCIFDVSATLCFHSIKRILTKNGVYVTTVPQPDLLFAATIGNAFSSKKAKLVMAGSGNNVSKDLAELADMVVTGKIRPIIEQKISLHDISKVQEQAEAGHNKGKIVVELN